MVALEAQEYESLQECALVAVFLQLRRLGKAAEAGAEAQQVVDLVGSRCALACAVLCC